MSSSRLLLRLSLTVALSVAASILAAPADASLLGDQIFIDRLNPDASGGPFS